MTLPSDTSRSRRPDLVAPDDPTENPKRFQSQHPLEAARVYARRYRDALDEGDQFLSSLYMDELLTSILLSRGEEEGHQRLSSAHLRS
jgi:hypothetical protein